MPQIGRRGGIAMKVFVFAVLMALIGAGGGFLGGYFFTVFDRIQTDTQIACTLLEAAEGSGYITNAQRAELVDEVVPFAAQARPDPDWIRRYANSWWDGIREDQKSGCPHV